MSTDPNIEAKPEQVKLDIMTKDGWRKHLMLACADAAKLGARGELELVIVDLFVQNNPVTGEPIKGPPPPPHGIRIGTRFWTDEKDPGKEFRSIEDQKERFVLIVRSHAVVGDAVASILMNEAWYAEYDDQQFTRQPRRQPKDMPNRTEVLVIMADHRDFGRSQHTATITGKPEGPRTIGPWRHEYETDLEGQVKMRGRMASFVPPQPENEAARRFAVMMAKQYLHELKSGGDLQYKDPPDVH